MRAARPLFGLEYTLLVSWWNRYLSTSEEEEGASGAPP